jgi:hypothetical protein
MAFIGNQPTAVPLTSSQLTDGLITTDKLAASAVTSAKILDSTIVNADIASTTINLTQKVTGTLPFANGGTGLSTLGTAGQALIVNSSATALSYATVGGLTEADLWTLNGDQTLSSGTDVTATPFARPTYTTFGYVGTGMTHSSGIFTFPSTGYYQIIFSMFINRNGSTRVEESNIQVSTDSGSTYSTIGQAQLSINQVGSVTYQGTVAESFVDVTNASTFRIRFRVYSDNGATLMGADLTKTQTHATFIKLAET